MSSHDPPADPTGSTRFDPDQTDEYPTETLVPEVPDAPDERVDADDEWAVRGPARGIRLAVPLAVLLALTLVAAGFWGGVALEKHHGAGGSSGGVAAAFASRLRGLRGGTTGGGGFGFGGGTRGGASAGTTGTISIVAGNTLYILTATGSLVKVTLSSSTVITRNADTKPIELRPGDTVVVQGATSKNGNVTAASVAATAPGVSSGGFGFGGGGGGGGAAGATTTTAAG